MGINVKRRKTDNIWLFDYTSLLSLSGDQDKLFFLSERDLNIIYQGLKDIDRFITRVFTEVNGDIYTTVDREQFEVFKQWQSDLFNSLGDWRVSNELLERIAEAVEQLEGAGCGCAGIPGSDSGSGGAGTGIADPSPIEDDLEAHAGPPPPGHASWAEYDQYKCDAAQYAFDQLLIDVATSSSITIGLTAVTELATLLAGLLLTPVGWVALLGIATIMISAAVLTGFYSAITTHLEANRDVYICAMLLGTDVASSISNFNAKVNEILPGDTGFTDPVTSYIATNFVTAFATIDSFNRLYSKVAGIPGGGDCSACDVVLIFPSNYGGCTPTLQSGSAAGPTATFRSCVAEAFGTNRALMTIATTVTGLEREFSNWTLIEGPDSAWVFAYVDAAGAVHNLSGANLSIIPDPLIAESWQLVRGVPSDTNNFDLQFDVAEV